MAIPSMTCLVVFQVVSNRWGPQLLHCLSNYYSILDFISSSSSHSARMNFISLFRVKSLCHWLYFSLIMLLKHIPVLGYSPEFLCYVSLLHTSANCLGSCSLMITIGLFWYVRCHSRCPRKHSFMSIWRVKYYRLRAAVRDPYQTQTHGILLSS